STEHIIKGVDDTLGTNLGYEPKTSEEKYAKSVAAGASGALLPGGKIKAGTRAVVGALGGGAGEAADQATNSPIVGILTNLATQLGFGHVASRKPQSVKAVQKDLEHIP